MGLTSELRLRGTCETGVRPIRPGRARRSLSSRPLRQEHGGGYGQSACAWISPIGSASVRHRVDRDTDAAALTGTHSASTTSGDPFSAIYVASSAALPLPTFFTAWKISAGMNKTSPALSVTGGLPSS